MIDVSKSELVFSYEASDLQDIKKCLTTLYNTKESSVPLNRTFGLNRSYLDKPLPIAKNEFALEVIEKTEMFEPRARVREVTFIHDEREGKVYPIIHLEKGDDMDE